jgi:predicted HicB family RNase H-like nuclease
LPAPTNKKYSGKFVLRTGSELHQALAIRALDEGDSLNNYLVKKLKHVIVEK